MEMRVKNYWVERDRFDWSKTLLYTLEAQFSGILQNPQVSAILTSHCGLLDFPFSANHNQRKYLCALRRTLFSLLLTNPKKGNAIQRTFSTSVTAPFSWHYINQALRPFWYIDFNVTTFPSSPAFSDLSRLSWLRTNLFELTLFFFSSRKNINKPE